jgi:hypothetical protein
MRRRAARPRTTADAADYCVAPADVSGSRQPSEGAAGLVARGWTAPQVAVRYSGRLAPRSSRRRPMMMPGRRLTKAGPRFVTCCCGGTAHAATHHFACSAACKDGRAH